MTNNYGPSTLPCGMLFATLFYSDDFPFIVTYSVLSLKNAQIYCSSWTPSNGKTPITP